MKKEILGHLCFLIGLGVAGVLFIFMYIYIIEISWLSTVSSGIVSMIVGVMVSEKLANYLDKLHFVEE